MPRDGRVVRQRLQQAALELFSERGYDGVTTGQIAERAGVTERTYFRHFPDKREVLFATEEELREDMLRAFATVPEDVEPMPTLLLAFHEVVPLLERNRPISEPRARIIGSTPALMERELIKAADLVLLVADQLQRRGVSQPVAALCAQLGMDAFTAAIRRWMNDSSVRLPARVDEAFEEMRALSGALAGEGS